MRCPICGSKMVQNQLCKYCNITDEQVLNASNKKVKEYRKKDMSDLVHFTNVIPKDISRLKLILFTIFLGLFGVNHYYVHRNVRGTFSVIACSFSFVFSALSFFIEVLRSSIVYEILFEISFYAMVINLFLWVADIINVFIKTFKVPVVLAEKETRK